MRGLFRQFAALFALVSLLAAPGSAQVVVNPGPTQPSTNAVVSTVGVRIIEGRIANDKTVTNGSLNGRTYDLLIAPACKGGVDAVRVITAVANNAGGTAITALFNGGVASVAANTDAAYTAATWTGLTWNGTNSIGGSGTLTVAPSASNSRRSYQISDWMQVPSVARTDGGAYPLYALRIYLYQTTGADGVVTIMGNGSQSFQNWATHPSGRIFRIMSKGGGYAASGQSGMVPSNSLLTETGSPIVGMEYMCRGKVVNLAGIGDSITEGQGTYIGEGWGFPAAISLSTNSTNVAYEWSDLGWSGQTMANVHQNLVDVLPLGLPFHFMAVPNGSPNDISTTISASQIDAMRLRLALIGDLLRTNRITPLVWTWLPSNTAGKAYGSSDSLRVAWNAATVARSLYGDTVMDFSSKLSGTTSSGQVQMLAGTTGDNIHPNDAGNALLAPLLVNAVSRFFSPVEGRLISWTAPANDNRPERRRAAA